MRVAAAAAAVVVASQRPVLAKKEYEPGQKYFFGGEKHLRHTCMSLCRYSGENWA